MGLPDSQLEHSNLLANNEDIEFLRENSTKNRNKVFFILFGILFALMIAAYALVGYYIHAVSKQIEDDNNSHDYNLHTLGDEVNNMKTEISNIHSTDNTLRGDINTANTDIRSLKSASNLHYSQITDIQGDIGTIDNEISTLQGDLTTEGNKIDNLENKIDGTITSVNERISSLEDKIEGLGNETRLLYTLLGGTDLWGAVMVIKNGYPCTVNIRDYSYPLQPQINNGWHGS